MVDILSLDPDPGSQNVADPTNPDAKHCSNILSLMSIKGRVYRRKFSGLSILKAACPIRSGGFYGPRYYLCHKLGTMIFFFYKLLLRKHRNDLQKKINPKSLRYFLWQILYFSWEILLTWILFVANLCNNVNFKDFIKGSRVPYMKLLKSRCY